jgi:glycosyltransferase involved in cell wall biosynthesis
MTPEPVVSVIIPCFNDGEFLDEAVESVRYQSFRDWEILILDDGSTDGTSRAKVMSFDSQAIRAFSTPNQGLAAARNFLISHARGRYLCALDADDRLRPSYLERTVAVLESEASLTFVSTRIQMFGKESREWPDMMSCDFPSLLCDDPIISAALVRREAVVAVGGYDERMPHQGDEDWDLWITLVAYGYHGTILPDVLFDYRRRDGSLSTRCTSGSEYVDLMAYLARKHADAYRAHLGPVLQWKDNFLMDIARRRVQLEVEVRQRILPVVAARTTELDALAVARTRALDE